MMMTSSSLMLKPETAFEALRTFFAPQVELREEHVALEVVPPPLPHPMGEGDDLWTWRLLPGAPPIYETDPGHASLIQDEATGRFTEGPPTEYHRGIVFYQGLDAIPLG